MLWQVSLDSVLHFTLPGSSGDAEASWKYSLAELRELQNKLMLMSAKGEQGLEVERFSEVRFQTREGYWCWSQGCIFP